jgi:transposase
VRRVHRARGSRQLQHPRALALAQSGSPTGRSCCSLALVYLPEALLSPERGHGTLEGVPVNELDGIPFWAGVSAIAILRLYPDGVETKNGGQYGARGMIGSRPARVFPETGCVSVASHASHRPLEQRILLQKSRRDDGRTVIPSDKDDDSRERSMMGRREVEQGQFFYAFDLDKVVPPDHLARQIDALLDLSWVHKEFAPYYSYTGRPSIDPVLMIRMLIVGYVFAIRSERRLCTEVQVNLAYRWFCKLSIEDSIPDHSVFSRARHERFRESDALRRVFESVVVKCIAAGLVGGEGFSIDASLIKADLDKKKRVPGDQPIAWPKAEEASRAVREYLAVLDAARSDEESGGGDDSGASGGGSRRRAPKEVSLTDPQAAWVARKGTDPFFAYDANYLIDNKAGIIVDAEGTGANRAAGIAITETMIDRIKRRFDLRPRGSQVTVFMAQSGCSRRWWIARSRPPTAFSEPVCRSA